mmetsp:Transcript_10739/g.24140  ORF Transcript_10739/g.24140 Transcript_10739/m.24140 type:complete len:289 (+) Transcript_10739:478-1344(+)
MMWSVASSPSTHSRRSSLKAPWKTRAMVCCCFNASSTSTQAAAVLSHCRRSLPERNVAQGSPSASASASALLAAFEGKDCTVSRRPRMESSRSFCSCSRRKRFRHSASMARAWRFCSSRALPSCVSWSLLKRAFSSQVLFTIFSMSASWAWNFALISCLSSAAIGPPPATPPPEEAAASFFLSSSISALRRDIWEASSFLVADTLIALARLAYRSVESVSSKLHAAGESVASIVHKEFPPRDSCSTRVSLEFRKGTKTFFPLAFSTRAFMTLPSALRLLLIFAPSLRV